MSYTISASEDGKYIIIEMHGDMTCEVANEHVVEAHTLGAILGIRCYLVDITESRYVQSAADNFKLARQDIRELPTADRRARVAVLAAPDDHPHDLYIIIAKTAGLETELLRDRESAISFLVTGG